MLDPVPQSTQVPSLSCHAPAGVAAIEAGQDELVIDHSGQGAGVTGEPHRVFAECGPAVNEQRLELASPVEELGRVALEAPPGLVVMERASYCEYLMTIAVTSMSLATSGALCWAARLAASTGRGGREAGVTETDGLTDAERLVVSAFQAGSAVELRILKPGDGDRGHNR
jgi:hypothetical protein